MGILRRLFGRSSAVATVVAEEVQEAASFFTSERSPGRPTRTEVVATVKERALQVTPDNFRTYNADGSTVAMDSSDAFSNAKSAFAMSGQCVPDAQLLWYASQGFIGFQLCAIIAQQWLVDKACSVPARDAIRHGYKVTVNDGAQVDPALLARLKAADKRYGLKRHCMEFVKLGRVFGIRIALFKVQSTDPKYYEQPFNPDGITPGSYKGIVQVDPYWCTPELSFNGAVDPTSPDFYDPAYWLINGRRYHKSHLVIMRGPEVPDLLKPSYQYAGMSLPQRIYERVYAAERTANETPQLALTKRAMIFYTDTAAALANQGKFEERLSLWTTFRDNFGVKVADKEGDKIEQHDTSLADLDTAIMTQYQLVAAIANVPATKLLGTQPKGFNSTGDYEEASYHEELESIRTSDMQPLIERHHMLVIRSEIAPAAPFAVTVEWEELDAPTSEEAAKVRKLNAETDKILVDAGALDGADVRARVVADPSSGYDGLDPADVPPPPAPPIMGGNPATAHGLDSADFDPVTGQYADATLITNQKSVDPAIVAQKITDGDYLVQLSPEFQTAAGQRYRVIIDGHHSLAAAIKAGATPVFVQANYEESDYRNAVTQLPCFGQENEVA